MKNHIKISIISKIQISHESSEHQSIDLICQSAHIFLDFRNLFQILGSTGSCLEGVQLTNFKLTGFQNRFLLARFYCITLLLPSV